MTERWNEEFELNGDYFESDPTSILETSLMNQFQLKDQLLIPRESLVTLLERGTNK